MEPSVTRCRQNGRQDYCRLWCWCGSTAYLTCWRMLWTALANSLDVLSRRPFGEKAALIVEVEDGENLPGQS